MISFHKVWGFYTLKGREDNAKIKDVFFSTENFYPMENSCDHSFLEWSLPFLED